MRRIPPELHVLRGNPGKRAVFPGPRPETPETVPEPPPFLEGYAAEEWRRIAPELYRLRLLTVLDVAPLAAYCESFKTWREATEVGASAEPEAKRLLDKIARDACKTMVRFGGHFGLSPASRGKIAAGGPTTGGKFDGLIA
jgi:P27 family predicted phage terminase small subunit